MDYVCLMNDDLEGFAKELITLLNDEDVNFISIESLHILHNIEILPRAERQFGMIKWQMNDKNSSEEIMTYHFPRLYYYAQSFFNEFFMWQEQHEKKILKLTVPLNRSPAFDVELHRKIVFSYGAPAFHC